MKDKIKEKKKREEPKISSLLTERREANSCNVRIAVLLWHLIEKGGKEGFDMIPVLHESVLRLVKDHDLERGEIVRISV